MRLLLIVAMSLGQVSTSLAMEPQTPTPTPKSKESLSEKLDKGKGVIKPPSDLDPGITRPAPEMPNTTPVIPPPEPGAK
jgi:hypothetical protein